MDNGNGVPAANGNGHANGHIAPPRPIFYRALVGEARVRYSPSDRYPRCACRVTFAYPNHVVLALDDERRQLVTGNLDLQAEVDELRQMVSVQGKRVAELEEVIEDEVATSSVVNEELRSTRAQLTRLREEVRSRASDIVADATRLVDEAMGVAQDSEEDPEEDPEEEVPPDSPAAD
ncbi:uncharacterized protein [Coffea arabica]|uniref:Uncharacterized protein n=1 Tax=Coffea arabica TaxID=13443 RepID=A0ABM4VNZ4_COFAR